MKLSKSFFIKLFIFLHLLFSTIESSAQNKYWVFFKDKSETYFDPYNYFDSKAIERRIRQNLPLYDYTDLPVNENYLLKISAIADSISKSSRWFNAVAIYATEKQIKEIHSLSFVASIDPMVTSDLEIAAAANFKTVLSAAAEELLKNQLASMEGEEFIKKGIDGKGIRIAIFDAGFPTVDVNPAFEHIRKENRIIKTYDFVKNTENVYKYNTHGTMVFSCIAGKIGDKKIGLATGSEFLLARTERVKREPFSEEENWLAAVEWADKNGAQIINSSLAYTNKRYFNNQMNGRKSLVDKAANMAASKGILVVNAMGNEGMGKWKIMGTPADADSILSAGGIDPATGYHISFSSYGPTSDKRLKPNVCAFGSVIASGENGLTETQGTSFSAPLIAGFAACAWQTDTTLKNMDLFKKIEKSGDLYPYFDYAHGYGVPQASYFVGKKDSSTQPTFNFIQNDSVLKIVVKDEFLTNIFIGKNQEHLMYYHIKNSKDYLDKYFVIYVTEKNPVQFILNEYKKGDILMVHFGKYTSTYQF